MIYLLFYFFLLSDHLNTFILFCTFLKNFSSLSFISKDRAFIHRTNLFLSMQILIPLLPFLLPCSLYLLQAIFISRHFKISLFQFPFSLGACLLVSDFWWMQRELLHQYSFQGHIWHSGPARAFAGESWLQVATPIVWILFWSLWTGQLSPFLPCSKTVSINLGTMDSWAW